MGQSLIAARVMEGLYIRGNLRGRALASKRRLLRRLGVTTVTCLTSQPDPDRRFFEVEYLHYPLVDGPRLDKYEPVLRSAVRAVCSRIEDAGVVLVHCDGGRNRAGLVAALTYMITHACSPDHAIEAVRAVRPTALTNQVFVDYIRSRQKGDVSW